MDELISTPLTLGDLTTTRTLEGFYLNERVTAKIRGKTLFDYSSQRMQIMEKNGTHGIMMTIG